MATTQTTELQLFKPEIGGEEDTWGQLLNTNMDEIDAHAASVNTTLGMLGTAATEADTKYAHRANNLSDLQSASSARTSLGLGTAATQADTKYNHRANNLSDVANQSTARGNLGLGTAAVQNDTRYNHRSNNLSDVANAATARVNLGAHDAANLTTGVLLTQRVPTTLERERAFRQGNVYGAVSVDGSGLPTGGLFVRGSGSSGGVTWYWSRDANCRAITAATRTITVQGNSDAKAFDLTPEWGGAVSSVTRSITFSITPTTATAATSRNMTAYTVQNGTVHELWVRNDNATTVGVVVHATGVAWWG